MRYGVFGKDNRLFNQQGWSYGLIRYLDTLTWEEVHQIDAHQGDRWEKVRRHT